MDVSAVTMKVATCAGLLPTLSPASSMERSGSVPPGLSPLGSGPMPSLQEEAFEVGLIKRWRRGPRHRASYACTGCLTDHPWLYFAAPTTHPWCVHLVGGCRCWGHRHPAAVTIWLSVPLKHRSAERPRSEHCGALMGTHTARQLSSPSRLQAKKLNIRWQPPIDSLVLLIAGMPTFGSILECGWIDRSGTDNNSWQGRLQLLETLQAIIVPPSYQNDVPLQQVAFCYHHRATDSCRSLDMVAALHAGCSLAQHRSHLRLFASGSRSSMFRNMFSTGV